MKNTFLKILYSAINGTKNSNRAKIKKELETCSEKKDPRNIDLIVLIRDSIDDWHELVDDGEIYKVDPFDVMVPQIIQFIKNSSELLSVRKKKAKELNIEPWKLPVGANFYSSYSHILNDEKNYRNEEIMKIENSYLQLRSKLNPGTKPGQIIDSIIDNWTLLWNFGPTYELILYCFCMSEYKSTPAIKKYLERKDDHE